MKNECKDEKQEIGKLKISIAMLVVAVSMYCIKLIIDSNLEVAQKIIVGVGIYLVVSIGLMVSGVLKRRGDNLITPGKLIVAYLFMLYFGVLFGPYFINLSQTESSTTMGIMSLLSVPIGLIGSLISEEKSKVVKTFTFLGGFAIVVTASLILESNNMDRHIISYIVGFFLGSKMNRVIIDNGNRSKGNKTDLGGN